ncbi:MAG: putative proteinB [Proteobacteria bacterium]|nr:putative proteinB [Pseudomonadota bacterium]
MRVYRNAPKRRRRPRIQTSMTTRICLVRHGETAWNAESRIQGQIDIPLNANGVAQARATANGLLHEEFAAIYASDLVRARHTAEAIAHVMHLPLILRTELRERNFGLFQGCTHDECRQRYPVEFARFRAHEIDFVLPGGESLRQFAARAQDCVGQLARQHGERQILVVTHGGVLDMIHRRATGHPLDAPRRCEIPNAALNWIEVDGSDWSVLAWADRGHLTGALDELPG